jgi:Ca-activated chloride channel family protein
MTYQNFNRFILRPFTWTLIALAAAPSHAQLSIDELQTANEINAANKLFRDGKVDEAIEAYRKTKPDRQHRDEWNYNLAVAEYRKGNLDAAVDLFNEAAGTGSSIIASSSRYNLGNCQYSKALQAAEHDKSAAIDMLRHAISNYRSALHGNPDNSDARANIELAGEFIRQLQDQQKQDDQKQQDQNDPSQESDSKNSAADQKSGEQQKDSGQQTEDRQQKDGEQNKSEEPGEGESDDQESPEDESQSEQRSPSEPKTSPNQPDNKDSRKDDPQNSPQQSDDLQTPDKEGRADELKNEAKTIPDGDLTTSSKQDETNTSEHSIGMADPNRKDSLMTREEALKMLQSVRDRDMLRRMQQQRKERSRHVSVEKDW